MIRLFNVYHPSRTFILACSEMFLVVLSFITALLLLQGTGSYWLLIEPAGLVQLSIATFICLLCLYYFDLYNLQTIANYRELLTRLLQVFGTASLILAALYYFFPALIVARGIHVPAILLLLTSLFVARIAFGWVNQLTTGAEKAILVGTSQMACDLAREIQRRPELGIKLVGYLDDSSDSLGPPLALPRLGPTADLEKIVKQHHSSAYVAVQDRRGRLPMDCLLRLRVQGIKIQEAGTVYERVTGKIPVGNIFPSWLVFSDGFRVQTRMMRLQRLASFLVAPVCLLLALPVMVVVAVIVKLDSKGPVLFRQERVGQNSKTFILYKFRSMRQDAENGSGAIWAIENDPRITRVGRFLRKFRLDELPQLWNVLRGDMNFVGPRPERPQFVQMLEAKIPYYAHRHIVRPGITGWAQVHCGYGSTVEEQHEKLRYDFFYIKNISPSLDFYILAKTVKIVLWGRGAK
jgi:sugar transferase (PEP-CTERM system associated)